MRHLARVAFFLSGVAGLTFEIVWTRYLGLAVGTTTVAVATVTATYMGGLALGSHLGGRIADRLRRPLAVYGALEIGIGLVGIGIPYLCLEVSAVDAALPVSSTVGRALVRFVVAACLLIVPTTAMGMTLPILARAVTTSMHKVGREVGYLYALNIGGAVLGAAMAGFWWIPNVGRTGTNGIAVGLDVTLGLVALGGGLLLGPIAVEAGAQEESPLLRPGARWLIAVLGVTGAVAMALQVLWIRAVGTALGPSTYAFSAIVCAYLAGLAIGGAAAARLADQTLRRRFALSAVLLGTGLAAFVGIALVDDLPVMLHGVVMDKTLTVAGLMRTNFALAALSILPATIGMGAIFPLTLAAVVGSDQRIGAAVGRAYAVNTVGAVLGSVGGVFVLLPLFGVEWGMRVAAFCYLILAAALAARAELSVSARSRRLVLTGVALVAILSIAWPSWNVGQWTLGIYRLSMAREYYTHGPPKASKVIFHRDGLAATVTVEEGNDARWIKIDGKIDGSSSGDMPTQVLSGLVPKMIHPRAERVAVVGCGSCVTVGSVLRTDVKAVTLIELERAVLEAAPLFAAVNHDPFRDPRLTVVEDDGRNFMRRGAHRPETERFDIIISEPSNPWMTGSSSLFTVEFFNIAKQRLTPGGLFTQWLQIYELAPERIASVMKTFHAVFPHVLVLSAHRDSNDLLMLGSDEPITFAWEDLVAAFRDHAEELDRADLNAPEELAALFLFGEQEIAAVEAPINTDDNGLIEFGAPRDLLTYAEDDPEVEIIGALKGRRFELIERVVEAPAEKWPDLLADLAEGYLRQGMLPDVAGVTERIVARYPEQGAAERAVEIASVALLLADEDSVAVVDGETVKKDPQYAVVALALFDRDPERALRQMEAVPSLGQRSAAHSLLYGYLLYMDGELARAKKTLVRAEEESVADAPFAAAIRYYLAKVAFEDGECALAAARMREYRDLSKRLSDQARRE